MADSEQKKEASTLITLELDVGSREFQTIDEIQSWMNEERAFFEWMRVGQKNNGNAGHAWNLTNQWLTSVNTFINDYRKHQSNEAQLKNVKRALNNQINQLMAKSQLVTSKNPDAIFGRDLSVKEDEVTACYAMAYLLNVAGTDGSPSSLKGAYYAFQYKQGNTTTTVKSQTEALKSLATNWNDRFTQQHLDLRSKNEGLHEEIEELRKQFATLSDEVSKQKEEQVKEFGLKLGEYEKTLSSIAETYDKKLALQASVKYWEDKQSEHDEARWLYQKITYAVAGVTGCVFILAAYVFLKGTFSEVELWKLGVMLVISTFGIWVTRLCAKNYISNLHLSTDARERVTMIQTYLALLRDGVGPKDEERQLILQTLFRPSTTGFIKDDGPILFHEIVTNALAKNR